MAEPRSTPDHPDERKQSPWTWLVPLSLLAALVGLYFVWPGFQQFVDDAYRVLASGEQQQVEQWVRGFGAWSFAVILALMLMQTLVAVLPSVLLMVVAVLAYGPVLGGLLAWGGLLLAAGLGYGIGRGLGSLTVDRLIGAKAKHKVEHVVDRYGVWAIIAARISPVLSTDAVSIVAGLVKMRVLPFLAASAAGTLPLTVLIAYLGADIRRLTTGLTIISIASLAIFVGYVLYDQYQQRKQ